MDIKIHSKKIALAVGISALLGVGYYYFLYCGSTPKQGCPCSTKSVPHGTWAYKDGSTQLYCKPN